MEQMFFLCCCYLLFQFAYRAHRSTEKAFCTPLNATISHLEQQERYTRLLFVNFRSSVDTTLPDRLKIKLMDLWLSATNCCWVRDFLSERVQRVRVGPHYSPQPQQWLSTGCAPSPLLYTLYDVTASAPTLTM